MKYIFLTIMFCAQSVCAQSLQIDVKLTPAGSFQAITNKVKGSVQVSGNDAQAESVVIDLKSLTTGISLRDKHMKERLNVEQYPMAKLIKAEGKGGKGTATLEIKGQKIPVAGTYEMKDGKLRAQFKMKMSDLGINDVRYMGVGAKDEVTVSVELPTKG
jgi:polyisoprenoid-binding protein YceI